MSTFGIESTDEIKRIILSLIPPPQPIPQGKTVNIRELIKFDSTFTLNPYKGIILNRIIHPKVVNIVNKINNFSMMRKPFSYFIDKSGDRKPELVEIYKDKYLVNCITFSPGKILMCDHLENPETFYINFIVYTSGLIYNHIDYISISTEDLNLKIIFGDKQYITPFKLDSWILLTITTSAIYINGELKHKWSPIFPTKISKPSQIGSLVSHFSIGFMSYFPIIHDITLIKHFTEFYRRR